MVLVSDKPTYTVVLAGLLVMGMHFLGRVPDHCDNYFAPKPGTMPPTQPVDEGHGVTPVVLPTRSAGSPLALRHGASQLAQAKRDPASCASHAPQAQAQAFSRAHSV